MQTKPGGRATVLVAGDWAPIRRFDSPLAEAPQAAYGGLLPALRAADLRIVNLECALAEGGQPVWKSGSVFKGRPGHLRALSVVPFEVACLANNHVLDYGEAALAETLQGLRGAGIRALGAGLSEAEAWEPLRLEAAGQRLCLVNFSEGEDLTAARGGAGVAGWEVDRVCELVRRGKGRGDCVLVVAHAGLEYVPFPPPYLRRACRAIVDAGADGVAVHHAHVPQGIESYRGRPIAYSLGNFLFHQPTNLYWRKVGYLLELEIASGSVRGWQAHPYRIRETGLEPLGGAEEAEFRAKLQAISRPLQAGGEGGGPDGGAEEGTLAWEAFLDYYGAEGLRRELGSILAELQAQPPKGAAMLRNRLLTPQHVELWRGLLPRILHGEPAGLAAAAAWRALVAEWFEREAPSG